MQRSAYWLFGGIVFSLACTGGGEEEATSVVDTSTETGTPSPTSSAGTSTEGEGESSTDSTGQGPETTAGASETIGSSDSSDSSSTTASVGDEFLLTSPNHQEGAPFADAYTCASGGFFTSIIPQLDWTPGPVGTQVYAITFLDVTLVEGGGGNAQNGYHWAIWNIPADVLGLEEGFTDAASIGAVQISPVQPGGAFFGPCPMGQLHTYEFTIYALASTLDIPTNGQATTVVQNVVTTLEADNLGFTKLSGTSDASPGG